MDGTQLDERVARNQALFRTINERTELLNEAFADLTPYGSWICECANTECLERIDMTLDEYESLRANSTWFAVASSERHVAPDIERIVEKTDRYWVVEKLGTAGTVATELAERPD
jgi:hypothetical protein